MGILVFGYYVFNVPVSFPGVRFPFFASMANI